MGVQNQDQGNTNQAEDSGKKMGHMALDATSEAAKSEKDLAQDAATKTANIVQFRTICICEELEEASQAPRGVLVGLNVGFKVAKQVYRPMSKKPNANTSGNKKDMEPTKDVSNSNPFEVLNSVENDVDLGTNRGTSNLASKKANSSGSSFGNVRSSSTSTTPIIEKIDKIERLIIDGKVTLN
ncbi:hypothetical protein Tco_0446735 [Tanacetum coccineum]